MIKLVVFDVDDTLTVGKSIWEQFYIEIGTWDKIGKKYLDMFRKKEITFNQFMELDVGEFAGNHENIIYQAIKKLKFIDGIKETIREIKNKGAKTAIVSGTMGQFATYLKDKHGFDFCYANPVETDKNGILTGKIDIKVPPMQKDITMCKLKNNLGIKKEDVLAVGDYELDFKMFDEAGTSVCVEHAPESVKKRVDFILPDKDLRHLLPYLASMALKSV